MRAMDQFATVFLGMGLSSMFFDDWSENFDIVGSLPLEVAVIILRKLDPKSLLTAITVCRKWLRIVKSDKVLRKTVRDELIRQKKERTEREMFVSTSLKAGFSVTSTSVPKKSKRKFEVSVKNVNRPTKRRKVAWESTTEIRRIR